MEQLTRVQAAISKVVHHRLFFTIVSTILLSFDYKFFINPDSYLMFFILCLANSVFAIMVFEDLTTELVDVRLAGIMALLLAICTKESSLDYIYSCVILFMLFFIAYSIISILLSLYIHKKVTETTDTQVEESTFLEETPPKHTAIPFLPNFFIGILLTGLSFSLDFPYILELVDLNECLFVRASYVPLSTSITFLAIMLSIVLLLEFIRHKIIGKRYKKYIGFGLGDVLVFPIVASFTGIIFFVASLFYASIITICIAISKRQK